MPYSRAVKYKNRSIAVWKWLLSFLGHDWDLDNYPVAIAKQEADPTFSAPRFKQHTYRAYIVNWAIAGWGDTPEQARADLARNFTTVKQKWKVEGRPLVRPGTLGPIEFASQAKVSDNEALSEDFVRRVLGLEWAWISDESSLWDFHTEQSNDLLYQKIREVYGVDVSDIESARLWEILERIDDKLRSSTA